MPTEALGRLVEEDVTAVILPSSPTISTSVLEIDDLRGHCAAAPGRAPWRP